jgi:serine/threonine-protein kinase
MEAAPAGEPALNDFIGGYRVLGKLGQGGFGCVFKVERDGRHFALKLLNTHALEEWGQREIHLLRRIEHPNVVRYLACGRWPERREGRLYFVMEYVEGRTLKARAEEDNPSARWCAHVFLEVALALGELAGQGVLHRDIKPENILIREVDGRPLLVDFGVGAVVGEPTLRRDILPPGTEEYCSPEAVRFERAPGNQGAHYPHDVGDELWALGVCLYWALTDRLPFGTRHQAGLKDRIVQRVPKAPHVLNARVPRALSALCMRMLEKERQARLPGYAEVCGALDAALSGAPREASWDVPLIDPEPPDALPTDRGPEAPALDSQQQAAREWKLALPRRGRTRARQAPAPRPEPLAGPPSPPAPAEGGVHQETRTVRMRAPAQPVAREGKPRVARPEAAAPGPWRRAVSAVLPTTVGMLPVRALAREAARGWRPMGTVLGVLLLASAGLWLVQALSPTPPVREVAKAWEAPEAGQGAAPPGAPTPAPLAPAAMLPMDETPLKTDEKPALSQRRKALRSLASQCVGTACCTLLAGCAASAPQVRPTLKPEPCPRGAKEAMKELGIRVGDRAQVAFPRDPVSSAVTVRESTPVYVKFSLGKLGSYAVLSGRLILGESRVYGRFTQARTHPNQEGPLPGDTVYPVCIELQNPREERGVERVDEGGPVDSAVVGTDQRVQVVERFE